MSKAARNGDVETEEVTPFLHSGFIFKLNITNSNYVALAVTYL